MEASDLTEEEMGAISSVVTQTQDAYDIAATFGGDMQTLRKTLLTVLVNDYGVTDGEAKALIDALRKPDPRKGLPVYANFFAPIYQNDDLIQLANKLDRNRIEPQDFDSGDIVNARYYMPSKPLTPEEIAAGVDIPIASLYPPVPDDFLKR